MFLLGNLLRSDRDAEQSLVGGFILILSCLYFGPVVATIPAPRPLCWVWYEVRRVAFYSSAIFDELWFPTTGPMV